MCGIVGYAGKNGETGLAAEMQLALRGLINRGPDGSGLHRINSADGFVELGHARLAIIDRSSGGVQPMATRDGRYAVVFNGEVYNYLEVRASLKAEGCLFRTKSDTEVLLAAWSTWGLKALSRCVGMFAFAMFDSDTGDLTLVRDAFGIKPLYYFLERNSIFFASEIPALLALTGVNPVENTAATYRYLTWGQYDDSADTFFDGIRQLPPGHYLKVNLRELARGGAVAPPCRWWAPSIGEKKSITFNDATEQVRHSFLSNLRMHLRSDVPLAVSLSGGIDSSAVLCGIRHLEPEVPINAFSYVARGSDIDEERWVDFANAAAGSVANKILIDANDVVSDIDDMIRFQGEPFGGTSIYAQYRVCKAMRSQGFVVALEGQGADEIYAGYSGFPGARIHSLLDEGRWLEAYKFLRSWLDWPGRRLPEGVASVIAEISGGASYSLLSRLSGRDPSPSWLQMEAVRRSGISVRDIKRASALAVPGRRLAGKLAQALTERGLPALLRHGDRNAMRFSVENRVPFLTTDQVEFALSLPERFLVSDSGETKRVLRAAMRGIVPDAILDRRDKIGFKTPEREWIVRLINGLEGLTDPRSFPPLLNYEVVHAGLRAFAAGRGPSSDQVWRWINYIRWHQQFFR